MSPGFKFHDWELKGVPLRLEIGPRDLEAGVVVMSKRLNADPEEGKQTLPLEGLVESLPAILSEYQDFLLARATAFRDEHTLVVDDWDAFVAAVSTGWAVAFHCGKPACEDDIKALTQATPRNIPTDGARRDRRLRPLRRAVRVRQAGHLRACLLVRRTLDLGPRSTARAQPR